MAPMSETRSGYRSSMGGLLGALLASLTLLGVVVLPTLLRQSDADDPAPTRDYTADLAQARAQAPFDVLAPQQVPADWRATSARWLGSGPEKSWHLGFLTGDDEYVGLEQGNAVPQSFIEEKTQASRPGSPLEIDGEPWQTLTDGDTETALVLSERNVTTIVTGTAPESDLVAFADSLR